MPRLIRSFFALSTGDKLLLLRAAFSLLGLAVAVRVIPFSSLTAICQRTRPVAPGDPRSFLTRVTYAVNASAIVIPGSTCLVRGLACQRILGAEGIRTILKIGVIKNADSVVHAHAWLEYEGEVILGGSPKLRSYSPLGQ